MYLLIIIVIYLITIAGMWKIFEKAGVEGWKALIPVYNFWVLAEIVGKPGWVGLLLIIPYLNYIVAFYLFYLLAKSFNKSVLFALGLTFLGFIFFPILGFGDATYQGPPEDDPLKKIED